MTTDQIQIVRDDLEYILDLVSKVDENTNIQELVIDLQVICSRDLRILGGAK